MNDLCSTCLSVDRNVTLWNDFEFKNAFIDWFQVYKNDNIKICWECKALLKKINMFKRQVLQAQKVMEDWNNSALVDKPFSTLSKLASHTKVTYDTIFQQIKIEVDIDNELDNDPSLDGNVSESDNPNIVKQESRDTTSFDSANTLPSGDKSEAKLKIKREKKSTQRKNATRSKRQTDKGKKQSKSVEESKSSGIIVPTKDRRINGNFLQSDEKMFVVSRVDEEQMLKNREEDRRSMKAKLYKFECETCIIGYYTEELYNNHMKKKHDETIGKLKCSICGTYSKRKELLNYHVDRHYRTYRCKSCDFAHHRLSTMLAHFSRNHDKDATFPCAICDKIFFWMCWRLYKCLSCDFAHDRLSTMLAHFSRNHDKDATLPCAICDKVFFWMCWRLYKCLSCDFAHDRLSTMLAHFSRNHDKDATLPCAICDKVFFTHRARRYHRETTHRTKPDLECEQCHKTFRTTNCLNNHIKVVHKDIDGHYPCPQCDKVYSRLNSLKAHVYTTHSEKNSDENNYCVQCDKHFKTHRSYKVHILENRNHRLPDKLKFECQYCGNKFVKIHYLKAHVMRVHEGASPRHKCTHCDKSYVSQTCLKNHIMEVHDGIPRPRNHLCSYCAKGFNTQGLLRRHIRVHTGERPYQCELCSMTFKQQSTLGTHIKLKHKRTDIKLPGSPKRI